MRLVASHHAIFDLDAHLPDSLTGCFSADCTSLASIPDADAGKVIESRRRIDGAGPAPRAAFVILRAGWPARNPGCAARGLRCRPPRRNRDSTPTSACAWATLGYLATGRTVTRASAADASAKVGAAVALGVRGETA
jgi:hypothetical protein